MVGVRWGALVRCSSSALRCCCSSVWTRQVCGSHFHNMTHTSGVPAGGGGTQTPTRCLCLKKNKTPQSARNQLELSRDSSHGRLDRHNRRRASPTAGPVSFLSWINATNEAAIVMAQPPRAGAAVQASPPPAATRILQLCAFNENRPLWSLEERFDSGPTRLPCFLQI